MSNRVHKEEKPDIPIYFDSRDGSYWYRIGRNFVALKKADMKLHLQTKGLSDELYIKTGEGCLREIDYPFWEAMNKRLIQYAGALAGHRVGTFTDGSGSTYLVTTEARGVFDALPKGKVEAPEFFSNFVAELLPGEQGHRFFYWLSCALRSLRDGDFRPGQALILAGPPKCGKSLLQMMITEILGGRSGNPFGYLVGDTKFNRELAGAEHWCIEDPPSTTDLRTRRQFGNNIKNNAFARDCGVQPKGKDTVQLPVFKRITISVNDEPENLAVCPPLESSINDKLMLFKCAIVSQSFNPFREGGGGIISRKRVWETFISEVPTLRAWLIKSFARIPLDWQDERCGVRYYLHPDLQQELCSLAPENRMLQLIDYVKWDEGELVDRKSFDLENELHCKAPGQVTAIAKHLNWCGTYLGRLLKAGNQRISKRVKDGHILWTIKPHVPSAD